MMIAANLFLSFLALPVVLSCLYLLLLTLLSARSTVPVSTSRTLRFDIIIPAHNEAMLIERVIASLQRSEWPTALYRIVVIADNCTDGTAALARAAGVAVIERHDATRRGKGYALQVAFQESLARRWADAVVVVDADSEASANLLTACAARLEQGAHAVQVHYGVLEPRGSWRTRLLSIALGAFHVLRSRARERLQVSCGLRGNGWCVDHAALKSVPYRAFSLAEDIEYGIELGLAGFRVYYADEADVHAEMVADTASAGSQRRRWEQGRFDLVRRQAPLLLRAARRARSAVALDLGLDLLVLPLSYVVLNTLALLGFSAVLVADGMASSDWLWMACACGAILVLYVLRGWQLSNLGWRGLVDLACAPAFIAWKALLLLQPRDARGWVRTRRRHR